MARPFERLLIFLHLLADNDPRLFGFNNVDPVLAGRLRAEEIRLIMRYTPVMLLANVINILVLNINFVGRPQHTIVSIWAFSGCGLVAALYWSWRRLSLLPRREYASVRAPRRALFNAIILGIFWAIPTAFFIDQQSASTNLVVCCMMVGMLCVGAFALSAIPSALIGFSLPILMTSSYSLYARSIDQGLLLAVMLIVLSFVIFRSSFFLAGMIVGRMLGQFEQEKQRQMISIMLGEFEEGASGWMWETDRSGNLSNASQRLYSALACNPEDLQKASFVDLLQRSCSEGQDGRGTVEILRRSFLNGEPFQDIELHTIAGGSRQCWSLTGRPILNESGHSMGFRGFATDVTSRRDNEEWISYLARYDAVTGIPNRVLFSETLDSSLSHVKTRSGAFALFTIDLDGFKEVNDTFGHGIGDKLLKVIGQRLVAAGEPSAFAARLGGDEFAIIHKDTDIIGNAGVFAQSLINQINEPVLIDGFELRVGASIGIALAPGDSKIADQLMINADLALYRAKANGRNRWVLYNPVMSHDSRERRQLEVDIRKAVSNDKFRLVFQPVVGLTTGHICAFEALVRWNHPQRGEVAPAEFIPLAEETGLIVPLGEWVINEACRQAATWNNGACVAINFSAVQFHSPGLLPAICKALERHNLPAHRLHIEITETVLISNMERVSAVLSALALLGIKISLDDFGTGYSSLSYIRSINFSTIKIDKSFVAEITTDAKCAAIVRAVIGLARETGMSVTAEGIETAEQLAYLKKEGCTFGQGFLFSAAMEADAIPALAGKPWDQDRRVA